MLTEFTLLFMTAGAAANEPCNLVTSSRISWYVCWLCFELYHVCGLSSLPFSLLTVFLSTSTENCGISFKKSCREVWLKSYSSKSCCNNHSIPFHPGGLCARTRLHLLKNTSAALFQRMPSAERVMKRSPSFTSWCGMEHLL